MMRIFLFFFSVFSFVFADGYHCPNGTRTETAGTADWALPPSTQEEMNQANDNLVPDNYNDGTWQHTFEMYSFSQSGYVDDQGTSTTGDDVYHYHWDYIVQECKTCVVPDETYDPPPDENWTEAGIIADSCIDTDAPKYQQCADLGGTMFPQERTNCCMTSSCYVNSDQNETVPDQNDTCEPPLVKEFGSNNCVCPPDHYPSTLNGELTGCLPNSDCDPGKHQIYQDGHCICPDGQLPDFNGTCSTPTDPDQNQTGSDQNQTDLPCPPGQYNCNGTCVLIGVTCSDTNNSNPGGGGNDPSDPCSYPVDNAGLRWTSNEFYISDCAQLASLYGAPDYSFLKNDDCFYGACYTGDVPDNNDTNNSGGNSGNIGGSDTNGSGSGSGIDYRSHLNNIDRDINKFSKQNHTDLNNIKNEIKGGTDRVTQTLNSLNDSLGGKLTDLSMNQRNNTNAITGALSSLGSSLGGKLDGIKGAIDGLRSDGNGSGNGDTNITLDMNETNDILREINATNYNNAHMDGSSYDARIAFETESLDGVKTVFDDALLSFSSSKDALMQIVQTGDAPTFSYGGGCTITSSVSFGVLTIDLSTLAPLRPFVMFILNFLLLIYTIKLYVAIYRDIMKYFASGGS